MLAAGGNLDTRRVGPAKGPANFKTPWYLRNGHVQTLVGYFISGNLPALVTTTLPVDLGDGDRLLLHITQPQNWLPEQPSVLLVHGLTGSHRSSHVVRVASMLERMGWRVARADLRGAGEGFGLARKLYHVGQSGDLLLAARAFMANAPDSPLAVVGFSLGGNIVLKLALEATGSMLAQMAAVVAICPPVDPEACVGRITSGKFRVYDRVFYAGLKRDWEARRELFPDLPSIHLPRRGSLRDYDELITAPLNGYGSAAEYYRDKTTAHRLTGLTLPTFIVAAADDPVVTLKPLEDLAARDDLPANIRLELTARGGHLGFMDNGPTSARWAERRVVEWLAAILGG